LFDKRGIVKEISVAIEQFDEKLPSERFHLNINPSRVKSTSVGADEFVMMGEDETNVKQKWAISAPSHAKRRMCWQ
jgi:hypothetical protein